MKVTHCKLSRKQQPRLLEYFILKVTARLAVNLLGIQPNSAALFYRKLHEVMTYQLEQKEHEVFDGTASLDERYFSGVRKGKRGRGAAGKNHINGIENFGIRPSVCQENTMGFRKSLSRYSPRNRNSDSITEHRNSN